MRKILIMALFMVAIFLVAGTTQAEPHMKVYTDKNNYNVGEEVQITKVNKWNDYVVTGWGYRVTTLSGEVVYAGAHIEIGILVPSGGSLDYTWDQTYNFSPLGADGEQVATGKYVIHDIDGPGKAHIKIV